MGNASLDGNFSSPSSIPSIPFSHTQKNAEPTPCVFLSHYYRVYQPYAGTLVQKLHYVVAAEEYLVAHHARADTYI